MNRLELEKRARRIRLVLSDVDGVLTDGGVYYSARGEEMKRFSLRDGMGVERLRDAGIQTAFITREDSDIVRRRAEKLALPHSYLGVRNKLDQLPIIREDTGFGVEEIAYIGDDVNDLEVIEAIRERGLTSAPCDAVSEILEVVHRSTSSRGGHGAFREFAEWILDLRGASDA